MGMWEEHPKGHSIPLGAPGPAETLSLYSRVGVTDGQFMKSEAAAEQELVKPIREEAEAGYRYRLEWLPPPAELRAHTVSGLTQCLDHGSHCHSPICQPTPTYTLGHNL